MRKPEVLRGLLGKHFPIRGLRAQLALCFVGLVLFSAVLIGMFSFVVSSRSIRQDTIASSRQAMRLTEAQTEMRLSHYDRIGRLLLLSDEARRWFALPPEEFYSPAALEAQEDLKRNRLFALSWNLPDVERISFVSDTGNLLEESAVPSRPATDPREMPWFDEIPRDGELFVSPAHRITPGGGRVVTLARRVGYPTPGQEGGYLLFHVRLDAIGDLLSEARPAEGGYTFIADADGALVWHPDGARIGRPAPYLNEAPQSPSGSFFYDAGRERELVVFETSELTGWHLVSVVPYREAAASAFIVRNFTVLIVALSVAFAVALAGLAAYGISRPIYSLKAAMERVEAGDFEARAPVSGSEEVASLSRAFNKMVRQIREHTIDSYRSRLRETRAELKQREASLAALQAQMNPHFLYNSLDTINAVAIMEDQPGISRLVHSLTDLLRYSADYRAKYVTLRQELEHLEAFLEIQQTRYGEDRLKVTLDVPEDLMDCLCLKLSLQPLLENSCKHGLETRKGPLRVAVRARREGKRLILTVEDDGPGIETATLAKFEAGEEEEVDAGTRPGRHVGLANLRSRLLLAFGPEYDLKLSNAPGGGLVVRMELPKREVPEESSPHGVPKLAVGRTDRMG